MGRTPRNTTAAMSDRAEQLTAVAAGPRFIEEQEAAGQREMVAATTLPTKLHTPREEFIAVGFTFGDPVPGDRLLQEAMLPDGWTRQGSDHAMWSFLVDGLGRRRASIFYKAAFYDRDAFMSLNTVQGYVAQCLEDGTDPVLDAEWATRDAVLAAVAELRALHQADVQQWTGFGKPAYAADYRKKVIACDALTNRINGGAEAAGA